MDHSGREKVQPSAEVMALPRVARKTYKKGAGVTLDGQHITSEPLTLTLNTRTLPVFTPSKTSPNTNSDNPMAALVAPNESNCISLNCQHVGVGPGGSVPMLARVSVVDFRGRLLLDTYVQPTAPVTNYRTYTTGITAEHLYNTGVMPFEQVQAAVGELVRDRFIIGYTLWWDFSILGIRHPAKDTRDVALYLPFRAAVGQPNTVLGLPTLVWHFMRRRIAMNIHDSAENARAALDLYRSNAQQWEGFIAAGDWPCALPPVAYARCFT